MLETRIWPEISYSSPGSRVMRSSICEAMMTVSFGVAASARRNGSTPANGSPPTSARACLRNIAIFVLPDPRLFALCVYVGTRTQPFTRGRLAPLHPQEVGRSEDGSFALGRRQSVQPRAGEGVSAAHHKLAPIVHQYVSVRTCRWLSIAQSLAWLRIICPSSPIPS